MGIKKYIIFTGTISDMGGGQMYVYNKQKYVESIGYTPYIFTNRGNNIIIKGFHLDKVFRYNCLSIFPFLFSEKKQQKKENFKISEHKNKNRSVVFQTKRFIYLFKY